MKQQFLAAFLTIGIAAISMGQTEKKQIVINDEATAETLISYEQQSWATVKRKDYETFASFIADDFCDIFPNGQVVSKSELLQNYIRGVDLIDYSLSDFRVVMLNQDAAIVAYIARAHGTESQSKSRAGAISELHAAVTSGWAKRNGKWLNVFYRENDLK